MSVGEPLEECAVPEPDSIATVPAELSSDDPLRLFLGDEPSLLIRWPSSANCLVGQSGIGSILVVIEAETAGERNDLDALLSQCARVSSSDARIAVLMPNPFRRMMGRLSALLHMRRPDSRRTDGTIAVRVGRMPTVGQVERSLRASGFGDIAVHSADQCQPSPGEIRPRAKYDAWAASALLVTARREGSRAATRLASIVEEATRTSVCVGAPSEAAQWSRIRNSSRGKSLVIAQCGETEIVIHLPRWAVAQADMGGAHLILHELQSNAAISRQVPRPLGHGTIEGQTWYAETRLPGIPLVAALSKCAHRSIRRNWLREADAFLRALNPGLPLQSALPLTVGRVGADIRDMLDRLLMHLSDDGLRRATRMLFENWLSSTTSPMGLVHGDFGTSNILVAGNRVSGVIDWEAARQIGPPVLDAFNYIDSVERYCRPQLTIVETIPMLVEGNWPDEDGLDFLRRFFEYCGIDFRFRKGFALLYFLFHVGPQLRFAARERGPLLRAKQLLRELVQKA